MTLWAGASKVDITPPAGMAMAGFAARTGPALGAHDELTVRAVAVNDTALLVADVIGLHEDMSQRVRKRCVLPDDKVVITSLHTHGGPVTMAGRLGTGAESEYLSQLEDACVEAINKAVDSATPARLLSGMGADPKVARNRRHDQGPLDRALPVLKIESLAGRPIAVLLSYACHPVVLGADNRLWTADYPHFTRTMIEAAVPGALALFFTGCVGDSNTGHTAQSSLSLAANPERSFESAKKIGHRIGEAALASLLTPVESDISTAYAELSLYFQRQDKQSTNELAKAWRIERSNASQMRAVILDCWIKWAENADLTQREFWNARVAVVNWGGFLIVAMPGEIFAESSLTIRSYLQGKPAFVIGFSEGNPGYIPPESEYHFGGYEIEEAHRYYGMPATFKPGSAEAIVAAVINLVPDSRLNN